MMKTGAEVRLDSRLLHQGDGLLWPKPWGGDYAAYSSVARGQSCPSPRPQELFSEQPAALSKRMQTKRRSWGSAVLSVRRSRRSASDHGARRAAERSHREQRLL